MEKQTQEKNNIELRIDYHHNEYGNNEGSLDCVIDKKDLETDSWQNYTTVSEFLWFRSCIERAPPKVTHKLVEGLNKWFNRKDLSVIIQTTNGYRTHIQNSLGSNLLKDLAESIKDHYSGECEVTINPNPIHLARRRFW
jgi:hypothetical protein